MSRAGFVHLHTHSAYSLAEGAIKVKDLVKLCVGYRMPAVAVTDTNNLFGAMEFAMEAQKSGVQPIIGAQLSVDGAGHQIVLLAQTELGYRNLCRLVSDAYLKGDPAQAMHLTKEALAELNEGLICLSGGVKGTIAQFLLQNQDAKAEEELLFYKKIFGDRFYIELQRHDLDAENQIEGRLIDLAYKHEIPLVATNDCYFAERESYEAHDALLCIADGRYITEDDRRRETEEHYFKSIDEMEELFADIPEAIQNTLIIAQRCSFLLEPVQAILPAFPTEAGRTELQELEAQAKTGLEWRLTEFVFPHVSGDREEIAKPYRERLEFELDVIKKTGYPGYFLIVSDFIRWAKDQNIPVGPGRGSGAASVVAWSLKITDLDPLEHKLLFERFLNPERIEMPDFDIDFCQERRDEVIRYVQNKYGYDRVAQIITFGKLQARAVVRDVGRVLQMPYGLVDRIAKLIPNNPAKPVTLAEALESDIDLQAERDRDDTSRKLILIALQLEGLYRHASTHAAGVVIGDRPLYELLPMYRDPRSDMPVTQFSMKYVGQAGLVKFDFLGLKNITAIQKTLEMIERGRGEKIDLLKIPMDDERTYKMMARGENTGVFQMESAGMRDLGRQMKVSNFEHIIAVVALYRPGPMENIPRYLASLRGTEEIDYLHPKLQPMLEDTYGVMIYQEQVMQAAQILAGYTLGNADLLRRAMGKKIQSEMDAQRQLFVKGAADNSQVPPKQANAIFDQIAKFAGYGFNKAHSAAYALIAYWTAWLKTHYPLEFMAASMTLDMGNTDKLAIFKQDLDRMGIKLMPPDVNKSQPDFAVEGEGIRYALGALKGVGAQAMAGIVNEREKNGVCKSLEDFVARLEPKLMNKRSMEHLAAAGAFESLNPNRAQMAGAAEIILRHTQSLKLEKDSGQVNLFDGEELGLGMPELPAIKDWDPFERLAKEFAEVGFYLSAHPLDSRRKQLESLGITTISDVEAILNEKSAARLQMAAVLLKKQEKISAKGNKYAFLQLSDPTGIFEATLFSDVLNQSREYLEAGQTLLLSVDAEQREDQVRYTVQKIAPLDKALEGKIREIQIYMNSANPAPKIKQFLDIEGKGAMQVTLFINLPDKRQAKLQLPGRWSLSAQARNKIRVEEGVVEILEA